MADFLLKLAGKGPGEPRAGVRGKAQVPGGKLRPCIARILAEGVTQGCRNEAAHLIASEMRRLGRSRDEAAGVIKCWNLRNRPRLPLRELLAVLESAYSGKPYSYGCAPDSHLRRILKCFGEEECQKLEEGACARSCACRIE